MEVCGYIFKVINGSLYVNNYINNYVNKTEHVSLNNYILDIKQYKFKLKRVTEM